MGWEKTRATQAALAALHPILHLSAPEPFKIGIADDLKALYPDISGKQLTRLFKWLTNRRAYLKRCTLGAPRYDLYGNVCGSISEREAAHAVDAFQRKNTTANDPWPAQEAAE